MKLAANLCIPKGYIVLAIFCAKLLQKYTKIVQNDMGQEVVVSAVIIHFLVGHMTVEKEKC